MALKANVTPMVAVKVAKMVELRKKRTMVSKSETAITANAK